MKSLIILKGLVKQSKLDWVREEGLENYFLDINVLKKMFSTPELISPDHAVLGRSFGDLVYQRFMEVLCTRLSKGCLVVIDIENDVSLNTLETLAVIFGYTVFYKIQDIPQDYLGHQKKYSIPYYSTKRKDELEREVSNFLNLQLQDKITISKYQDVIDYWKERCPIVELGSGKKVLHVSDLHSNFELYKQLPKFNGYSSVIFHGDYIDGPEQGGSRILMNKVVKRKVPNAIWLEGNHELRLRKYLGWIVLAGKKDLQEFMLKSLPDEFLNTTATEFSDLNPIEAKEYLEAMNRNLKLYAIVKIPGNTYICTHAGIRYREQLDPRFIGSVVYGNRDMNRYDREFSDREKRTEFWSIHAHCKYPDSWEVNRYSRTMNLDPEDEFQIVCGEQLNGSWKIWQLKRNLN